MLDATNTWQLKSTTINYTFDGAYRLESESRTIEDGAGTVTNWSEAYEYDEVGNRETKTTTVYVVSTVTTYYPNARNQIDYTVTSYCGVRHYENMEFDQ